MALKQQPAKKFEITRVVSTIQKLHFTIVVSVRKKQSLMRQFFLLDVAWLNSRPAPFSQRNRSKITAMVAMKLHNHPIARAGQRKNLFEEGVVIQ